MSSRSRIGWGMCDLCDTNNVKCVEFSTDNLDLVTKREEVTVCIYCLKGLVKEANYKRRDRTKSL
jgi:hypothetical protein